jgi:hypothetical protein
MKTVLLVILSMLATPASAAMYKWVDKQGRTQYSDTPPPAGAKKVEEQKFIHNTIDTGGAPFAVREAAKRNPVTVWMNDCGSLCDQARNFLARRGVPHAVRNPSRQDEQNAWKNASGGDNSVPLLIVGTATALKGFDEAQWNAALDAAGYPRSAPALKPQAIPAAAVPPANYAPAAAPEAAPPAPQ